MTHAAKSDRVVRILTHGTLWGLLTSVFEWVSVPAHEVGWSSPLLLLAGITPGWCAVGFGLAAWIEFAGARLLRPGFLIASVAGCAVALSALWSAVFSLLALHPGLAEIFPSRREPQAAYLYQAWVIALYGGMYFFVWGLNHRAVHARTLLHEAQVARVRTEIMLGEAQLRALRGHVDPQLLSLVVGEAARRYPRDTASADRLIGLLVAFLRLAMPGIRSGRSSLRSELALADAYLALRRDVEPLRATWMIAQPPPVPDVALPPVFAVMLIDSVEAVVRMGTPARLDATIEDGTVAVSVEAGVPPGWLPTELEYRLKVALSVLHGRAWTIERPGGQAAGACALRVSIRLPEHLPSALSITPEAVDACGP